MSTALPRAADAPKLLDLLLQVELDIIDQHMAQVWSKAAQSASNRLKSSTEEGAGESEATESQDGAHLDDHISMEDLDIQLQALDAHPSPKHPKSPRVPHTAVTEPQLSEPTRRTLDNIFRLLNPPRGTQDLLLVVPIIAFALRFERPQMRVLPPLEAQALASNFDRWTSLIEALIRHVDFQDHFQALSYVSMAYEFQKTTKKPLPTKIIRKLLSQMTPANAFLHEDSDIYFPFSLAVLDLVCTWAYYSYLNSKVSSSSLTASASSNASPKSHDSNRSKSDAVSPGTQSSKSHGTDSEAKFDSICNKLMFHMDSCVTFQAPKFLGVPTVCFNWSCARAICATLIASKAVPPSQKTCSSLLTVLSISFQRSEGVLNPLSEAELKRKIPKEDMMGEKLDITLPKFEPITDDHVLNCMWSLTAIETLAEIYSIIKLKSRKLDDQSIATANTELLRLAPRILACAFPRSFRPPYRKLKAAALNAIDSLTAAPGSALLTTLLDCGLRIAFNCVWLIRTLFPNYFKFRGTISQLNVLLARIEIKERKPRFEPLFPSATDWDLLRAAHDQSSFEFTIRRVVATDTARRAVISTLQMLIPPRVWTSQAALFVLGKIFSHPKFHTVSTLSAETSLGMAHKASSTSAGLEKGVRGAKSERSINASSPAPSHLSPLDALPKRPPIPSIKISPDQGLGDDEEYKKGPKDVIPRKPATNVPNPNATDSVSNLPSPPRSSTSKPLSKAPPDVGKVSRSSKSAPVLDVDPNRKPLWEDPCKSLTLWDLTIPQPNIIITTWEEAVHAFCRTGLRPEIVFALTDELRGVDACELINSHHIIDGVERFLLPKILGKGHEDPLDPGDREEYWCRKLSSHLRPFFVRTWLLTPSLLTFQPRDFIIESWRSTALHLVYEQSTVFSGITSPELERVRVVPLGEHRGSMFNAFYLDIPHSGDVKMVEKAEAVIKTKLRAKSWNCLFLASDDTFHFKASKADAHGLLELDYGPAYYCLLDLPAAIHVAKTMYPACPIVTIIPINSQSGSEGHPNCVYLKKPDSNPVPISQLPHDPWSRAVICIRNDFRDSFANKILASDAVLGPIACSWWTSKSQYSMRHYIHLPPSPEELRSWQSDNFYNFGEKPTEELESELSQFNEPSVTRVEESEETAQRDSFTHDEELLHQEADSGCLHKDSELCGALRGSDRSDTPSDTNQTIPSHVEDNLPHLRSCPLKWESDTAIDRVSLWSLLSRPRPSDHAYTIAVRHSFMLTLMKDARKLKGGCEKPPGVIVMRLKPSGGAFPLGDGSPKQTASAADSSRSSRKTRCMF